MWFVRKCTHPGTAVLHCLYIEQLFYLNYQPTNKGGSRSVGNQMPEPSWYLSAEMAEVPHHRAVMSCGINYPYVHH